MSLLLFGATGHLAQNTLLPRVYKAGFHDVYYVSKNHHTGSHWFHTGDSLPTTDVTYFSASSDHIVSHIEKIPQETLLCIESPIGNSVSSFNSIVDSINETRGLESVRFVDHYLCQHTPDFQDFLINPSDIKEIHITLHDSSKSHHTAQELVQSHVLIALSETLSRSCKCSRLSILNSVVPFDPMKCVFSKTHAFCETQIYISESYYDCIRLCVDVVNTQSARDEYSISVKTTDNNRHQFCIHPHAVYNRFKDNILTECELLPSQDSYLRVLSLALEGSHTAFPSLPEISRCWQIVSHIV